MKQLNINILMNKNIHEKYGKILYKSGIDLLRDSTYKS